MRSVINAIRRHAPSPAPTPAATAVFFLGLGQLISEVHAADCEEAAISLGEEVDEMADGEE